MEDFNKELWDKIMNDNVIKGPWKDRKIDKEQQKKVTEDMSFVESVTETDIKDQNFSLEIGFINECIKSMLYRELGYPHPMTQFIQNIVVVTEDEEKVRYSHFDTQRLLEILDTILDESEDGFEDE